MNSKERHEARYQRRVAKRAAKRLEVANKYANLLEMFSFDELYRSYMLCKVGTNWKASVQRFELNLGPRLAELVTRLYSGNYYSSGFHEFSINERGKRRDIKSVCIEERVVQKALTSNCLKPILRRYLIYDNGATLDGRGPHFQIKRLTIHLQRHYREYGTEGWIYLFDFHNYFGSIPLNVLSSMERVKIIIDNVMLYVNRFIKAFGEIGLGLGSEISQISAIFYPNELDHYVKDKCRVKGYGRYNDDGYIISHSKTRLKKIIAGVKAISKKLGLELNEKKCRIQKVSRPFKFLKTRIKLTDTGKVYKRVIAKTLTRERRRLKKFKHLLEIGQMTYKQIEGCYKSWRGSILKRGVSYKSLKRTDNLFNELFIIPFIAGNYIDFNT